MVAKAPLAETLPAVPPEIGRDIVSARSYGAAGKIYDDFAWLRANLPVGQAQVDGYDPFWVVTKHADIQEVGRQPDIFQNKQYRV